MPEPVDEATERTRRWWRQPDRYGALLVLLVLNYTVALLIESRTGGQVLILVLTIASLLFALHTSEVRGRIVAVAIAACVAAGAISVVEAARHDARASALLSMVIGLLLLATPISVLRRILGYHQIITSETLAAALSVYLLLGLAFANLYTGIDRWDPGTFTNVEAGERLSDLVYFSFITLTTVGYGDIVATSDLGRTLAVTEALMGQIILVTFVGRIVGLMAGPRGHSVRENLTISREEEIGDEPGPSRDPDVDRDEGADPQRRTDE
jgi:hypothetical protein